MQILKTWSLDSKLAELQFKKRRGQFIPHIGGSTGETRSRWLIQQLQNFEIDTLSNSDLVNHKLLPLCTPTGSGGGDNIRHVLQVHVGIAIDSANCSLDRALKIADSLPVLVVLSLLVEPSVDHQDHVRNNENEGNEPEEEAQNVVPIHHGEIRIVGRADSFEEG